MIDRHYAVALRTHLRQMLSFLIFIVALSSSGFAKDRESVGYVFDSTGDWMQDGVRLPHTSGDPVYAGSVISLDPNSKSTQTMGASIIINLFNGKREERSSGLTDFAKPITLPESLGEQTSAVGRLLRAMGGLFSQHSEKYLITTVRGADLLTLHEAVVKLDGDGIDLAPVFRTAPAGKYSASLQPIENDDAVERSPVPLRFAYNWKPTIKQPVVLPELAPGLWRISLLRNEDERPFGVDAWILICTPAKFAVTADLFNQTITITQRWGEKISGAEIRSFLRTALDGLAHEREE